MWHKNRNYFLIFKSRQQSCSSGLMCLCVCVRWECDCMSATRNNIPFMTNKLNATDSHSHTSTQRHDIGPVDYRERAGAKECGTLSSKTCCMSSTHVGFVSKWRQPYEPIEPNENSFYTWLRRELYSYKTHDVCVCVLCVVCVSHQFRCQRRRVVDCANLYWNIDKNISNYIIAKCQRIDYYLLRLIIIVIITFHFISFERSYRVATAQPRRTSQFSHPPSQKKKKILFSFIFFCHAIFILMCAHTAQAHNDAKIRTKRKTRKRPSEVNSSVIRMKMDNIQWWMTNDELKREWSVPIVLSVRPKLILSHEF